MTRIVQVAALTFRRPDLLPTLVESLARLSKPAGFDVRFLIVDNDPARSAHALVDSAIPLFDGALAYAAEPTPGIPAARNRAIQHAMSADATLLCFLDDDEIPNADWLERLVEHWRKTGAALIGGPLVRALPTGHISVLRRVFGKSLIARRKLAVARDSNAVKKGSAVPVYTSNWMCDLSQIADFHIRFNEEMQFSGGSDAEFYEAVRGAGLQTSWCPEAIMSEPIEPDRLTVAYQFGRSRSQGIVRASLSKRSPYRNAVEQLPRAAAGTVLILLPFVHPAAFAAGIDLLGSAVGHLDFFRGKTSGLYQRRAEP